MDRAGNRGRNTRVRSSGSGRTVHQLAASARGCGGAPGLTELVVLPLIKTAGFVLLLVVPPMTMHLVAEERRSGTLVLLLSSPLSMTEIIIGKYLGVMGYLLTLVAAVGILPVLLLSGGSLDLGLYLSAMLALCLMIAGLGAGGLFVSTLTPQPAIAAVGSFGMLLILWILDWAGNTDATGLGGLLAYLALGTHFDAMLKGLVDTYDIAYFLLLVIGFVGLSIRSLDRSVRSYRIAAHLKRALAVVFLATVVGLLAWLSGHHRYQWDWTTGSRNSLSSSTQLLLDRLQDPITITVYAADNELLGRRIGDSLERYQRYKGDLTVRFVDPRSVPDEIRRLGVATDGELRIEYDGRAEHIKTHTEQAITNALNRVGRSGERWIAFVSGHGERDLLGRG